MFHLTSVEPETYQLLQNMFTLPFVKNSFALAGGTSPSSTVISLQHFPTQQLSIPINFMKLIGFIKNNFNR